tara:strand:+ start:519 stop:968 length:450 start_codon:yes stop_codon:yes gene_type:complete
MTPSWIYVPAPSAAAASANYQVDGIMDEVNTNRYKVASFAESGSDAADWEEYPFTPIRKSNSHIEFLIKLTSTGQFSNKSAFTAATTNYTGEFTVGGDTFSHTSITIAGPGNGTIVRVRFVAATADINSYWSGVSDGESFLFKLSYEGV